ncbi:hypothetical protein [Denitratisoma oestradiolicum]|uniref:Uncharacterized protein n=1 Tax=Denitratisoma oestradiolicum TaxID=311182 RepID=A0A6S6Y0B5_9PROT|nr:hypothetical protein [Denitratisoma oestradiolicum]TWO79093.1 hypothetical protein CBW56_16605 [Denitratisoma oestradiolicum]CAB1369915.1 conserved protein of unknown function [Denitratisoma oestradiolicum]
MNRRTLLWVLCLNLPLPLHGGQEDQALGRLFFTPAQRQALARQPQGQNPIGDSLNLEGSVQGSDGRRSFWLNGRLLHGDTPDISARLVPRHPERLLLRVQGAAAIPVKVGESIDRANGAIRDSINSGSVTVHRAPQP